MRSDLKWAQRTAYRSSNPMWWANLAAFYATGEPPQLERARRWYERALAAGYPRAGYDLALMLLEGEGGPRDLDRGRALLETAAEGDDIDALKVLAHACATGAWGFRRSATRAKAVQRRSEMVAGSESESR